MTDPVLRAPNFETTDLGDALNALDSVVLTPSRIEGVAAHVPGENDELNWYWILKTYAPKPWALLEAWCDYTGWGCQEGGEVAFCDSPEEAVAQVGLLGSDAGREPRAVMVALLGQLDGSHPYGSVDIKPDSEEAS